MIRRENGRREGGREINNNNNTILCGQV